jgi:glycosyltransferase involved in cell wall biosynthesis
MNILILPINIASQPSITAEALNKIDGINAKCITNIKHPLQTLNSNTVYIPISNKYPKKKIIRWIYYKLTYKKKIKKWIRWADVLHYVWGPAFEDGKDVELALKLNKPIFIEWFGGDIRDYKYLFTINKHYQKIFNKNYEYYDLESSEYSQKVQKLFSDANATPLLAPEMKLFLNRSLFPAGSIDIMQRMNVKNFSSILPQIKNEKPLIIHSPSARVCKGTSYILNAVNELKIEIEFDFILIENLPRYEALKLMRECDIFIDQLIIGSYGSASIEAMCFGKPVVCYILPEVYSAGLPYECPIISANPDNIKDQLKNLIKDHALRNVLGKKSRAYVEKYHDADILAHDLIKIYKSESIKKKGIEGGNKSI